MIRYQHRNISIEIAPSEVSAGAISDVEWVDVDGDGAPDAVVSSPEGPKGTSRVQLIAAAGLYQRVEETSAHPGEPMDLEPR